MPNDASNVRVLRAGDLSPRKPARFDLTADADERAAIATELGLLGLRKLRFQGNVRADGRRDWRLSAHLGATVVQPCVVSLQPVTTRIRENVTRRFLRDWPPAAETGDEVEMPEDESIDPLEETIDLDTILIEALVLALPTWPRRDGATLGQTGFAPPGVAPLTDGRNRPFAGLSALKKKLENGGG